MDADHGPMPLNFCKSRLMVMSSLVWKYNWENLTPSGGTSSDSIKALASLFTNSAFLFDRPQLRSSSIDFESNISGSGSSLSLDSTSISFFLIALAAFPLICCEIIPLTRLSK
ncbi:hypothetical protein OGATHE_002057 [Ogataea polymorpha]|uniref:Uncharacterized protein n=1 Tax=Ogataea polymorpha TaxID=460523 RepID=A0A9P8PLI2_9ASCO|nr:hypothetical protein OGATHE_002057 [Ogataea polymorpha]